MSVAELRSYANRPVRVRLIDATEHEGTLRTEILGDHAISVFLAREGHCGATIYIDEIVGIWPLA